MSDLTKPLYTWTLIGDGETTIWKPDPFLTVLDRMMFVNENHVCTVVISEGELHITPPIPSGTICNIRYQ